MEDSCLSPLVISALYRGRGRPVYRPGGGPDQGGRGGLQRRQDSLRAGGLDDQKGGYHSELDKLISLITNLVNFSCKKK